MDELGKHFWWKTAGLVIGLGLLIMISWLLISGLAFRFGAIAALVIVFGIVIAITRHFDVQKQREYDEAA